MTEPTCPHYGDKCRESVRNGTTYTYCDPKRGGCGLANNEKTGGVVWEPLPKKAAPTKQARPMPKDDIDVSAVVDVVEGYRALSKSGRSIARQFMVGIDGK